MRKDFVLIKRVRSSRI